jgi:hypothetical protein
MAFASCRESSQDQHLDVGHVQVARKPASSASHASGHVSVEIDAHGELFGIQRAHWLLLRELETMWGQNQGKQALKCSLSRGSSEGRAAFICLRRSGPPFRRMGSRRSTESSWTLSPMAITKLPLRPETSWLPHGFRRRSRGGALWKQRAHAAAKVSRPRKSKHRISNLW